MKRKKMILCISGIAVAAILITGVIINIHLVLTPKNNVSTLTLERISSYTSEGEAGSGGGGVPRCNQRDETDDQWHGTIRVYGVEIKAKKREWHYCRNDGRKRTCVTGGKYWDYNDKLVYNSITTVDCPN